MNGKLIAVCARIGPRYEPKSRVVFKITKKGKRIVIAGTNFPTRKRFENKLALGNLKRVIPYAANVPNKMEMKEEHTEMNRLFLK
jgi:hypothetical protein